MDSELETLLRTLRAFDVETYEYKDTKIVFRFPAKTPKMMLVPSPQEQVEDFEAGAGEPADDDDDEEILVVDRATNKSVVLPPKYARMFRAVPRDVT